MRKILLLVFTIFATHSPLYSFAQNQTKDLAQIDLPDKTPAKNSRLSNKSLEKVFLRSTYVVNAETLAICCSLIIYDNHSIRDLVFNVNKFRCCFYATRGIIKLARLYPTPTRARPITKMIIKMPDNKAMLGLLKSILFIL